MLIGHSPGKSRQDAGVPRDPAAPDAPSLMRLLVGESPSPGSKRAGRHAGCIRRGETHV